MTAPVHIGVVLDSLLRKWHISPIYAPHLHGDIMGRMETDRPRVPLMDAAYRLGLTREAMLRRIMKREIAGGKSDRGHWFVYEDALEREEGTR